MQRHLTVTIVAVLATSLGGCGAIGEEVAEQAAEQATGADIDTDDGSVSIESDEGSISADEDGFSMETEDGTFESQAGQVPEGFPDEIPLPDATVATGSRMDTEDGVAWNVNYEYESGVPADVLQAQVDALQSAGFSSDGESDFSMGGESGGMAGALLEGDQYRVTVSAIGEADDFILGYQVLEIPPDEQQ